MSSTDLISALGAGSGVDVKALAESLVEAERAPRKERIDAKITQTEAKISGYGALKSALFDLQTAFKTVNDARDFSTLKATNSQTSAIGITTSSSATAGTYDIAVTELAQATRRASDSLALDKTFTSGLVLTFTVGTTITDIEVTTNTLAGIVSAVNAQSATTGISAQLINTGNAYTIVFNGTEGEDNDFTVSSNSTELTFQADVLQSAQDAELNINGIDITSSSNTISEALEGVTLNLYTTTASARVSLTPEVSSIKANIQGLVTAYNNFAESVKILNDRSSEVELFGGALAGDSLLQSIKSQVRSMITGDFTLYADSVNLTGPKNANINAAWQVGLSFDRNGKLQLDEDKLDSAFSQYPAEVVTLFSANTNDLSEFSTDSAGLAGTAVREIDKMLRSTSLLTEQTSNATQKIDLYKADLEKLEERMKALLERYMKQFALMESIVGSSNSMRESMKSSFEGMMASYTNN
jgi:flagellar hook-associated protein 2